MHISLLNQIRTIESIHQTSVCYNVRKPHCDLCSMYVCMCLFDDTNTIIGRIVRSKSVCLIRNRKRSKNCYGKIPNVVEILNENGQHFNQIHFIQLTNFMQSFLMFCFRVVEYD